MQSDLGQAGVRSGRGGTWAYYVCCNPRGERTVLECDPARRLFNSTLQRQGKAGGKRREEERRGSLVIGGKGRGVVQRSQKDATAGFSIQRSTPGPRGNRGPGENSVLRVTARERAKPFVARSGGLGRGAFRWCGTECTMGAIACRASAGRICSDGAGLGTKQTGR